MSASGVVELVTLQAVRLAGVANEEAVLDRALVSEHQVNEVLERAAANGLVEEFTFADTGGWMLTEHGSSHLAHLLAQEAEAAGARDVLAHTLTQFEAINGPFVDLVAQWQLRSTSAEVSDFAGADPGDAEVLLADLSTSHTDLRRVLADLTSVLPRFGRYPVQLSGAIDRARTEGLRWVTGVGVLSCHTVWAELHQDLLSSLGRGRGVEGPGTAG